MIMDVRRITFIAAIIAINFKNVDADPGKYN